MAERFLKTLKLPGIDEPYKIPQTAEDVGAVPTTRKVNGKALSSDMTLGADDVGARPNTWTPTAADIGAAPAEYGLGSWTGHMGFTDADAMLNNGWYYCNNVANTPFSHGWMFVIARDSNWVKQEFYSGLHNTAPTLVRFKQAGYWGEWEWENPPMISGVEYRTTERWNGKAVYTTMVDLGNLPNNNTASVTHGRAVKTPIRCVAVLDDSATIPYDAWGSRVSVCATTANIVVATSYDASHLTARAQMWYTKD